MKNPAPNDTPTARIPTGVKNLDTILHGGLPRGSVTVIGGPPGSGKTILSHQIGFSIAAPEFKVMYFQTLSEPTAKRLRYLKDFDYFDPEKVDSDIFFIDLGEALRSEGIEAVLELLISHVKRVKPGFVVLDSFKAFGDFVSSQEQFRKFSYEMVVRLMAWECTVLMLGEFSDDDFKHNPLFSVIDGLIITAQQMVSREQRRILQVVKMRGTDHSREPHVFKINGNGIRIFAPKFTIQRLPESEDDYRLKTLCKFGIAELDMLLDGGIPRGSSLLIAGVAGTGKTLALLEFLYQGSKRFGEKGLFVSFEETRESIHAMAHSFGWDLEAEERAGRLKILFVPQPEVMVEEQLASIQDMILNYAPDRIAIDSLSVFLDKVETAEIVREKVFQLATLVQTAGAVGLFATNVPYGIYGISRFSVEETVVDGVIILSAIQEGLLRSRYLEIYKLRNTAHSLGLHKMTISKSGIAITPNKDMLAKKTDRSAYGKNHQQQAKKKAKSKKK